MESGSAAPGGNIGQKDLSSVLAHTEMLQQQLAEKNTELGATKLHEESANSQVTQFMAAASIGFFGVPVVWCDNI
jgi:hypothetical protein